MENVTRKPGFTQVCVWPGTMVGPDTATEFESWFLSEFGTRVQYMEEIKTKPDRPGDTETGGRNDCFFAVHNNDIGKFAVPRLQLGIRWIEDVFSNGHGKLYPARVAKYKSW
jgi:hypothetical protein